MTLTDETSNFYGNETNYNNKIYLDITEEDYYEIAEEFFGEINDDVEFFINNKIYDENGKKLNSYCNSDLISLLEKDLIFVEAYTVRGNKIKVDKEFIEEILNTMEE